jgi:murein DD-endopeptidase MepM/ murein hydrolase activator NlpD
MTPTKAINLTATSIAQNDPIDRSCPVPPPGKPDYKHYYLSAERWLQPEDSGDSHFWFGKPLSGGGRLLYTDWLPYGYDAGGRYLIHNGLDSAEPAGSPILAAADGMIVVAGEDKTRLYGWRCDWYGNLVVIEVDQTWRDQPVYLVYGHVLNIEVEVGQRVVRGQQVAEVGVGGAATLPHLHFEVRVGTNEFASTRNPLLWLEPPSTRGLIAGRLVDPEGRPWQGVAVAAVGRSEGTETHTTWTYLDDPQHLINGDEVLAENYVFGDLRPGEYELYVELQGQVYTLLVIVEPGELTVAEIVTEAFKTSTPEPQPAAETQATVTP